MVHLNHEDEKNASAFFDPLGTSGNFKCFLQSKNMQWYGAVEPGLSFLYEYETGRVLLLFMYDFPGYGDGTFAKKAVTPLTDS